MQFPSRQPVVSEYWMTTTTLMVCDSDPLVPVIVTA
jgi:hypothetical protein